MKIERIDIRNFRKLEDVKVLLDKTTTLLVGANNSGKTSAIDALTKFLKKDTKEFVLYDWSISNWDSINAIGEYIEKNEIFEPEELYKKWSLISPTLDLWFNVKEEEIHHVVPVIPTLDWNGGILGIRFSLEPTNLEALYSDYRQIINNTKRLKVNKPNVEIWPNDMCHFLKRKLSSYFGMSYFTLNPEHYETNTPLTNETLEKLEVNPLKDLVKIDLINAQRGFHDANGDNIDSGKLSRQLRGYFDKQLSPNDELLDEEDIDFIEEACKAQNRFDEKLTSSFSQPISELRELGYPGFTDPNIHIATKLKMTDGLNHSSAVQYSTTKNDLKSTRLPEDYTGLGYQNLISMVFKLMSFRDEWMCVGKKSKLSTSKKIIQPLHLVIIEEPEAHLHTQVQQVFIKKAYQVLRNHALLHSNTEFSTQLLVSTHSSYIIEELEFSNLRYFKRFGFRDSLKSPYTEIVNLSEVFGSGDQTTRFVNRYIKTTHCDLFFADAAILIEGSAERMLLPEFIKEKPILHSSYLTILEIGGSHAYRLRPLIDILGIHALVISDLDPCKRTENNNLSKVYPQKGKNYVTKNSTLKLWAPMKVNIDELLSIDNEDGHIKENVFITYQKETMVKGDFLRSAKVIPSTFEDALVLENIDFFKKIDLDVGPTKKVRKIIESSNGVKSLNKKVYKVFADKNFKKAEFTLDVLLSENIKDLKPPKYIEIGLNWLECKLTEWVNEMSFDVENGDS